MILVRVLQLSLTVMRMSQARTRTSSQNPAKTTTKNIGIHFRIRTPKYRLNWTMPNWLNCMLKSKPGPKY
jgi:hypothetical protein